VVQKPLGTGEQPFFVTVGVGRTRPCPTDVAGDGAGADVHGDVAAQSNGREIYALRGIYLDERCGGEYPVSRSST
jgi:hypothetical protein